MVLLWALLAVGSLAAEVAGTAFFAVFLAFGFATGAAVALAGGPPWLQVLAAAVDSGIGVAVLRPLLVHRLQASGHGTEVIPGLVGQACITVDEVGDEHHPGHAMLAGERWLAVAELGVPLPPQTPATVIGVKGTTLIVRTASLA